MNPESPALAVSAPRTPDYSLTGANAALAIERGLAEADWYTTPVPKEKIRRLLQRRDGPTIRDTLLLVSILASSACATVCFWGTWWVVWPYPRAVEFYICGPPQMMKACQNMLHALNEEESQITFDEF